MRAAATAEFTFDPSPDGVRMLLVLLQRDVDPRVRGAAAGAIAERRDPGLSYALDQAAVADPDPSARASAARAHARLAPWRKRPGTAAGLSLLCPGCGQIYLGDAASGGKGSGPIMLGTTAALLGGAYYSLRGHEVSLDGSSDSKGVPAGLLLATTAQNLWFYSIFDAYRSARVSREDYGYKFKITRETLPELVAAPFRPSVIKSPWVWAGVPLALAAGIGVAFVAEPDGLDDTRTISDVKRVNFFGHQLHRAQGFAAGSGYYAALFGSVGVGEESLFRGVIQTELEERFGSTWGLIGASAIFGSVHVLNFVGDPKEALVAVPVITVLGASLGLAYQHSGHKLSRSVAMHFWYDTLLSLFAFAADPEHQPFVVNYSM